MTAPPERSPASLGLFRAQKAEELLSSLVGIISVRIVVDDDGTVEEIHVLSTGDISPKQVVRNVESALLAHLDVAVDHRRISVAQAEPGQEPPARVPQAPGPGTVPPPQPGPTGSAQRSTDPVPVPRSGPGTRPEPGTSASARFRFVGHQVTSQRSHRVETRVTLEREGRPFEGSAWTPDLPRPRLEAMAEATLRAMEQALEAEGEGKGTSSLSLEGVKVVQAFDRQYVLVSVHAVQGSRATALAGSVAVADNPEASVVLATLQATDRRIRGMIEEAPRRRGRSGPPDAGFGDPFDIWG